MREHQVRTGFESAAIDVETREHNLQLLNYLKINT